jgi:hypothetical protein
MPLVNSTSSSRPRRMNSAGSDTDSMLAKNTKVLAKNNNNTSKNNHNHDVVELFSTDSEMDSFFKENELIVNNNGSSSNSSPNKTDESNTMNEDLDDDEFDRIVSEAQRYLYNFCCFGFLFLENFRKFRQNKTKIV